MAGIKITNSGLPPRNDSNFHVYDGSHNAIGTFSPKVREILNDGRESFTIYQTNIIDEAVRIIQDASKSNITLTFRGTGLDADEDDISTYSANVKSHTCEIDIHTYGGIIHEAPHQRSEYILYGSLSLFGIKHDLSREQSAQLFTAILSVPHTCRNLTPDFGG